MLLQQGLTFSPLTRWKLCRQTMRAVSCCGCLCVSRTGPDVLLVFRRLQWQLQRRNGIVQP